MALVAVLLLVAGLIAIATAVITLSTAQRRVAQRAEEADARKAILDSALRVALVEIAFPKPEGPFWRPRQPRQVSVADTLVDVSLERESGRIDLNTAEERYLVAALAVAGLDEPQARTGAARIRDWIDADDEERAGGAERDAYRAAGLDYEPRNGPMETVEEVRQVIGLQRLTDGALDALTVYSQQREPAPSEMNEATREVWRWLAGAAGEGSAPAIELSPPPTGAEGPVSHGGAVIRLKGCAPGAAQRCRTAVVRVTGANDEPWLVLYWR